MENKRVKYPIGIQDFEKLREDGYLYIDKTALLYKLINSGSCYFLSRPRRFGKSLTLATLRAYFEGKKKLFEGLAIYDLADKWESHPVFHISFARFSKEYNSIESLIQFHLRNWEVDYGIEQREDNFDNRFANILKTACETTGKRCVVLVDEYDSALVSTLQDMELHNHIKSVLKPFYTVMKDMDRYIRFVFVTGITRFSKLSIFSGFNNLDDISLDSNYSALCGITEKELENNFHLGIQKLADNRNISYDDAMAVLKAYYDGYHFTRNSEDIYNPFSILKALSKSEISNYWFETGIPSYLVEKLRIRDIDLNKYLNQKTPETTLQVSDTAYTTDLSILFQAGFLTIKRYDPALQLYTLGIPNKEVRQGMSNLFLEKFLYPDDIFAKSMISELITSLWNGDPETFLKLLKGFFAGVPFDMSKGDKEVYFHNAFYIVTNLIGLYVKAEYHVSTGSIDILLTTDAYVYVIEIKLNKKPETALEQINSKGYALQWEDGSRKVFKIGVNFSTRTRTISRWVIE